MDRSVMMSGRLPAVDAKDEIALNESAAESYRKTGITVRVGDTIKVAPFELSALQAKFAEITRENREGTNADFAQIFRPISVRLVGIGRSPADVVSNANSGGPVAVMSRKYGVANRGRDGAQLIGVKLRSPGDLKAFERAAQALHPDAALTFTTTADESRIFDSGSRPYTDSLRLFAIVLGVTAALVLGQALARQVFADSGDLAMLRALGVTRRSPAAVAGLRSVVVGVLGAILALVIALSASGRFPIGPARLAEPHPGVRIAWGMSVAGLLVLLFFVAVAVGPVAWRVARPIRSGFEPERVRRGPRWLARASLPPAAAVGIRRALWPASRREPSIVVTVLGLGLALAALTVSVIFGASLGRLVDEPERWGWTFDALFDTYDLGVSAEMADALVADPAFTGVTIGTRGSLTLQGTSDVRSGSALPQTTVGRLPDSESEVALGERTLRDLGRQVGDEIIVTSSDGVSKRLRIVGSVVLPPALALNETFALGNGAVVTTDGLKAMSPGSAPSFALVDTKAAPTGANLARIGASYPSTQLNGPRCRTRSAAMTGCGPPR